VTVGLRRGGASWNKAKKAGLKVEEIGHKAVKEADLVMMLLPGRADCSRLCREVQAT